MAQTSNGLAFPSVNNSFLGASSASLAGSSADVDLYTGTAQVSIPICQMVSKELTIPVSLYYTGARGIRVQDYAGPAGLGWQLNAGGGISRVVRGYPDEFPNGYLGTGLWGQKVANALSNSTAMPVEVAGSGLNVPSADGEPDLFYVKTPFFSFQFTFDENGQPVLPNANGMTIIATNLYNNGGTVQFEVIDDNGNQFYFGSSGNSVEVSDTKLFGTDYSFITTWYLDKIVTFNSKDVITLTYTSLSSSDVTNHYQSNTQYDYTGHSNTDNTPILTTIYNPKVISIIQGSLGEVDLNYASDRTDNGTTARLSGIVVKAYNPATVSNSLTLNSYGFNYSYFGNTPSDPNTMRLKLDKITVTGNTPATAAPMTLDSFTYNMSVNLPSRTSLSAVDFWGYYTASASNPYNMTMPANLTYTMANVLTGVRNLTGETLNLTYELNDYYNTDSSKNIPTGGLRVQKISRTLPTGESVYKTYQYTFSNGHSTGEIQSNSYMINLWLSSCGVYKTLSESPSEFYDLNGNFMGYTQVKVLDINGGYTISTFTNFSSPNSKDILNYTSGGPIPDVSSAVSFAYKRGILIDRAVYTSTGNIISEDATPLNSFLSLTTLTKKSWAYRWGVQAYNVTGSGYQNSCAGGASSTYYSVVENFRPSKTVHTDYDQNNPLAYVQATTTYGYAADKRLINSIIITDSKGQTYSRSIYHTADAGIPMVTTSEQTALNYMAGAGINRTGAIIHQSESRNGALQQTHYTYGLTQFGYITRAYLSSVDDYASSSLVKQQFIKYDPNTSNIASVQKTGGQPMGYLYGYNSSLPTATVTNAVNTYTASTSNGNLLAVVQMPGSGTVSTTFTSSAAGNIVVYINASPGNTYSIHYSLTGPSNQSGYLCASRSSTTCSYPETVTFSNMPAGTYTLSANLNSGTATGMGVSCTYTGLIGNVAVTNGFFYEGFEEPVTAATRGNAHTGTGYYDGYSNSTYVVNFSLPDSRSYILQWWSWVNGKWVAHQQAYTGSVSLPGVIDDVRVFPADAKLSTFTNNPMVGKSGVISPDGKSATYEFDGLGRMNITRDQDGNIISKACYSYAGQPLGCATATIYSNAAKSGTYVRNNCGAGYQPGTVTYNVAAGTYTSSISQADADQQAVNDVHQNGQNYANTNGTCTFLYYNTVQSGSYTRNNCGAGYTGSTVTYTVAANTYSSTISQADANQKATNDVQSNGQNYANTNGTCTTSAVQKAGNLSLTGSSASVSFTSTIPQSITLTMNGWPGSTYSLNYSLTGPSNKSGTLCAQRSTTSCSFPESVTFTNMPAGTYTLTITMGSGSASSKGMGYTYYGAP